MHLQMVRLEDQILISLDLWNSSSCIAAVSSKLILMVEKDGSVDVHREVGPENIFLLISDTSPRKSDVYMCVCVCSYLCVSNLYSSICFLSVRQMNNPIV